MTPTAPTSTKADFVLRSPYNDGLINSINARRRILTAIDEAARELRAEAVCADAAKRNTMTLDKMAALIVKTVAELDTMCEALDCTSAPGTHSVLDLVVEAYADERLSASGMRYLKAVVEAERGQ
jgi:hypothetical protein